MKSFGIDDVHKLLFLDIDGVLNSRAFYEKSLQYKFEKLCKERGHIRQHSLKKLKLLKQIHDKTHCTIVLSSSWRHFYFEDSKSGTSHTLLKKDLHDLGIDILYKTSYCYNAEEYDRIFNTNSVTAMTPEKFYDRGYQIYKFLQAWEKHHGPVTFAILDDDDGDLHFFNTKEETHWVQTFWHGDSVRNTGLTKNTVKQCINILNGSPRGLTQYRHLYVSNQ